MAASLDWQSITAGPSDPWVQFDGTWCVDWLYSLDMGYGRCSGLAGDLRLLSEAEVIAEMIETRFSEQSAGLNQQEIDAVYWMLCEVLGCVKV